MYAKLEGSNWVWSLLLSYFLFLGPFFLVSTSHPFISAAKCKTCLPLSIRERCLVAFFRGVEIQSYAVTNRVWNNVADGNVPQLCCGCIQLVDGSSFRHGHRDSAHSHPRSVLCLNTQPAVWLLRRLLCAAVSFPLNVIGGISGRNFSTPLDAPCRTTKIPREIPPVPWYPTIDASRCLGCPHLRCCCIAVVRCRLLFGKRYHTSAAMQAPTRALPSHHGRLPSFQVLSCGFPAW